MSNSITEKKQDQIHLNLIDQLLDKEQDVSDETSEQNEDIKEIQFLGIESKWEKWEEVNNYDAQIIEIHNEFVLVDVLIDRENNEFDKRSFERLLFDGINNLKIGKYIIIKIRKKPNKISINIYDGDRIVDKRKFEDISEFKDLDKINYPEIKLSKINQ